jgi:hypothetical protein
MFPRVGTEQALQHLPSSLPHIPGNLIPPVCKWLLVLRAQGIQGWGTCLPSVVFLIQCPLQALPEISSAPWFHLVSH